MALKFILDPFYFTEGRYMKNGGKGGSAPKAPDPAETAAAQTASNKETAYWNAVLNNVNQVTPYGNLTYKQTGGGKTYNNDAYQAALNSYNTAIQNGAQAGQPNTNPTYDVNSGRYLDAKPSTGTSYAGKMPTLADFQTGDAPPSFTSTIDLSPDQQAILDSEERRQISMGQLGEDQIGRIRDSVSNPYSYDGIENFGAGDIAAQQSRAEEALMARMNPQFARDEEALRTRLINQGIGQGSQAYQREMEGFNQKTNDARTQAILAGQQYGSTAQQQALQRRNQSISEYDAQRNAPLNEYIGLTSGVQVQNPQFSSQNYQGSQPVDYAGLVNQNYQNQMSQYNAKQANSNNTMSSLFGLGGSFLGAAGQAGGVGALFAGLSDRRLKTDIEKHDVKDGYQRYKFRYTAEHEAGIDRKYIGVMAQEVDHIDGAVLNDSEGNLMVNYGVIGFPMEEVNDRAS